MKRKRSKKLALNVETLRGLSAEEARMGIGGVDFEPGTGESCGDCGRIRIPVG
jgi:hypothetical protein